MSATAAAHAAPLPSRKTWARNAQSTIGVEKISFWPNNASFWAKVRSMASAVSTSANGRPGCLRNGSATVVNGFFRVFRSDSMIYMTKPSMALVGRQAKEGQRNHRPRMAKDIIDLGRTKSKPTQGSSVGTGAVRKVVLCHAKAQNRRQCHSPQRFQWSATPVLGDVTEHLVFDLVP